MSELTGPTIQFPGTDKEVDYEFSCVELSLYDTITVTATSEAGARDLLLEEIQSNYVTDLELSNSEFSIDDADSVDATVTVRFSGRFSREELFNFRNLVVNKVNDSSVGIVDEFGDAI